MKILLVSDTRT